MWVYRIEKPPRRGPEKRVQHRYIDVEFSSLCALRSTHLLRLATEFRVPALEGNTMPSASLCSESSALFKQLLLRSIAVSERSDESPDLRLL